MTTSRKAHCHFLVFFLGAKDENAEDDDELGSLRLVVISWVSQM
jgi:hypothetical protein